MYKYMPLRGVFFENFLIRATQRSALNDPFEVLPAREWMEGAYSEHYKKDFDGTTNDLLKQISRLSLNDMGIISFTARPDNILMWSHYAEDHKGMVIEIDEDNVELKKNFQYAEDNELTHSVVYRRDRLQRYEDEKLFLPYLYKSIEWAYEEEHRILVKNLFACHCWIYLPTSLEEAIALQDGGELAGVRVKKSEVKGSLLFFDTRDIEPQFNPNVLINDSRFMSMFQIPPNAIKSVIFGVNADKSEVNKIVSCISNRPELQHINLRYAKLSDRTFGLDSNV